MGTNHTKTIYRMGNRGNSSAPSITFRAHRTPGDGNAPGRTTPHRTPRPVGPPLWLDTDHGNEGCCSFGVRRSPSLRSGTTAIEQGLHRTRHCMGGGRTLEDTVGAFIESNGRRLPYPPGPPRLAGSLQPTRHRLCDYMWKETTGSRKKEVEGSCCPLIPLPALLTDKTTGEKYG